MLNSSFKIIYYYFVQNKPFYTAILLILSLLSTACNIIGTVLLIPIFSILVGSQASFFDYSKIKFFGRLLTEETLQSNLLSIIISLSIIILIKNIANYGSMVIGFKHAQNIAYDLKTKGLDILCNVDFYYYQQHRSSEILANLNREIDKASLAIKSLQKILIVTVTIVLITVILLVVSWQLTLAALIALGWIIWVNNWLRSQASKSKNASIGINQSSNRQIVEFLSGIRSIKNMAMEEKASQDIAMSIAEKNKRQLRTKFMSAAIEPITEMSGMATILALALVTYYTQTSSTILPLLPIYLAIFLRLLPFLNQFNQAKLQYTRTRSSLEVVASFLNPPHKSISSSKDLSLLNLKAQIEFRAVSFAYPNHGQIILDNINFAVDPGKTIALVGLTGTGNSPIAELLTRFYPAVDGKILLDGQAIESFEPRSLRKAIAIVSRDTFLFNRSLADNIAYGLDDVTRQDIIAAAKQAQIYHFIEHLPAGLSTKVGEGGVFLSDLQKQQISFARAFLRNPKIVILDEPFALIDRNLLDLESIQQTIQTLTDQCTAVIITKQLDLAQIAQQIVLFNQGKIVATGTHQELLQQGGIYQRMYSMQFKTNQQSRQIKLAQKIARKLAQQNNDCLSQEIRLNLNTLLNSLESLSQGLLEDEEQDTILDNSFQSAKEMLASLKAYENKIEQGKID
ncbi:MAG: ABC transporter ATP-binding protein [Cyanobacteria bacterium J06600_6]